MSLTEIFVWKRNPSNTPISVASVGGVASLPHPGLSRGAAAGDSSGRCAGASPNTQAGPASPAKVTSAQGPRDGDLQSPFSSQVIL